MHDIRPVPAGDRAALAPLLSAYAAEMAGHLAGTTPASGATIVAMLDADPRTHVLAAWEAATPVGFAILFELPEAVFARRCGALDDLFVAPSMRGRGLARGLVAAALDLGRVRGWSHLRWIVPETDTQAIALYERIAERAAWRSYVIRLDPAASL